MLARRSPRRGFLAKTALVGSALAVAPIDFVTKPATAYARICNCSGSQCNCNRLCCDGYTEFCCTIYGTNGCPPGALYGGWWRVSGSNYCGGSNRYYMDCHEPCNGCSCGANGVCSGKCNGTRCGCALGSCRNRKAGCTHFRYGQCNQDTKCVGPIVCRVVTCTAPWKLEPNCTKSSRTDNATRNHNRPCVSELSSLPVGELDLVDGQPGSIRVRGWAIDADSLDPAQVNVFVNGNLFTSTTADLWRPDVGAAFRDFDNGRGFDVTFPSTIGTKEVCVSAVNKGGGPNPVLGCRTVSVSSTAPTGVLESISQSSGNISVSGWAFAPGDDKAVDVDLYVDDVRTSTVRANVQRRDLAKTFGNSGAAHGFAAELAVPTSASKICASITDPQTGEAIGLGCFNMNTASSARSEPPFGAVDKVKGRDGDIRVVGWALDPNGGNVEVAIIVDGLEVARGSADRPRADVALAHPNAVDTAGFKLTVPASPGPKRVCVYVVGSDGADGPILGCADVVVR